MAEIATAIHTPGGASPESISNVGTEVNVVLNRRTSPENQNAVNLIRQEMNRKPDDPAGTLRTAEPFRFNRERTNTTATAERDRKIVSGFDDLIDNNIGTKRKPDGKKDIPEKSPEKKRLKAAEAAKSNIATLLKGELPVDLQDNVIQVLLQWPTLQKIYGAEIIEDISKLSNEQRNALVGDIESLVKTPKFTEHLRKVCEAVQKEPGIRLDNTITPAEEAYAQARQNLLMEESAFHDAGIGLQEIEDRLSEYTPTNNAGNPGNAYTLLQRTPEEVQTQRDFITLQQPRVLVLRGQVDSLVDQIKGINAGTIKVPNRVQALANIQETLNKIQPNYIKEKATLDKATAELPENLKAEEKRLKEEQVRLTNNKSITDLRLNQAQTKAATAQADLELARKHQRPQAEDEFVATLKSIPERAVMNYMDERLEKFEEARDKVLEKSAAETKDVAERVILDSLRTRWKYQDTYESKRVRNTVTNPITGEKKKIKGYHYEKVKIKGEPKSDKIKEDFGEVRATQSAEVLMVNILTENADKIPAFQGLFKQAEEDAIFAVNQDPEFTKGDIDPTERGKIHDDAINRAKVQVVREWYHSQPPNATEEIQREWRSGQEKQVIQALYAERQNNCSERIMFDRKGNPIRVPLPIPDHENAEFLQAAEKIYGSEEKVIEALLKKAAENPITDNIVKELKAEADKAGESLLSVAKKKGYAGGILTILFGVLLTLSSEAGIMQ